MKGLSPRAEKLIAVLAQKEGRQSGGTQLLPEHVLIALLKSANGLGYILLQTLHVNILAYQLALEQSTVSQNPVVDYSDLPPGRRLRTLLDCAAVESRSLKNGYIGTEHLVLAAIREDGSITARYFEKAGISLDSIRNIILDIQSKNKSSALSETRDDFTLGNVFQNVYSGNSDQTNSSRNAQKKKNQPSFLDEYSIDMTSKAKNGEGDPVVGRDKEIKRVIQILSRRTKNNPILLGEPGVGKTAIAEGLSQHIAKGNVPKGLLRKRVLSLDLAALIAGTKYRGEFEERMKRIMKEIKEDKNIILFIDELHTIIGAGGPEGTMDASNMLKPALSRGELQIIGATTLKEYRKYFEKDSALERRFQVVKVEEPSDEDTTSILEGLKSKYEEYHGVEYAEGVIPMIVKLSKRYVPERFLPDKAIDILDEAGAAKKIEEEERPDELTELEHNIDKLDAEKKALVESQDYEKAAIVRDAVVELRQKLEDCTNYWQNNNGGNRKIVTEKDVCEIISTMTGVPVEQLDNGETERLLNMENEIHRSVIGQDEAVHLISSAVRRSRAGVSSTKRPIGSFIFLGPTGVGKTQLAKSLAKFLFGSEDSLVRVDMSDYMEKHNASRLVGAPPGYIGYEEGGILTEKVRQHPYSVVLLDEIEKAHPDVFNLLLQLLEEGELSDNLGHTVNFRNTVIIMTSNAGARQITTENRLGFFNTSSQILSHEDIKSSAMEELKKIMSPELLNRIDDVVVFNTLSKNEVNKILDIQLAELRERLAEKDLTLTISDKARDYMVEHGYDPSMGARPMRRLIEREIEDMLSTLLLSGEREDSDRVAIELSHEKLVVRFKKTQKALPETVK